MSPAKPNDSQNQSWKSRLIGFFYERLGLDAAVALAAKKRVPIHRQSIFYFLGGMALFLFGIQIITGILLALYYKPSPDQAFESVRAIVTEVDFGWLFRSIHSWSANLLIGVLFLHVLTTYVMRAYRRPREFTWFSGVALLGIFMTFGFSGYLLPWNQLAFFATKVGTAIAKSVPVIGHYALLMARGGEEVTGDTLARFYALHVVILPLAAMGLIGLHLFLVQKHGMSVPEKVLKEYGDAKKVPSMPFVPHFLLRDMVGWYIALGLLAALAALFPWELGRKAEPFGSAPPNIKPEWYFLFMFQALKHLPAHLFHTEWLEGEVGGVLFFGLCGLAVLALPLLDASVTQERSRRLLGYVTAVLAALLAVTILWFLFQAAPPLLVWLSRSRLNEPTVARLFQPVVYQVCCGIAVILIAFRTMRRGADAARSNLNVMAALAVTFFIVMTAWGLVE